MKDSDEKIAAVSTKSLSAENGDAAAYHQHAGLTKLSPAAIKDFLASKGIKISDPLSGEQDLRPIIKFEYLTEGANIVQDVFKSFKEPTPIQAATWPYLFSKRDVVGVAETGSGKTLAFGLPCIQRILALPKKQRKGIKAVIVSPTRELAVQIHEQLVKLAKPVGLECVCVYGGVPKDQQRVDLKKSQIVVATPGRLKDLMDEQAADLSAAEFACLDEADRMLDKGFEDDIRMILSATAPAAQRQTVMFTATWPESVRNLASTFMNKPVQINIGGNTSGELQANPRIKQVVEVMIPKTKEYRLIEILRQYKKFSKKDSQEDRILIFCLYKKEATRMENFIRSKGFNVAGIHGDLSQAKRTESLEAFKNGSVPLLVATDVAARGLDIPSVKLVLNYTFPLTAEDYVHRIGRTGRAGADGKAITFFTEHEKHLSGALIAVLKGANQQVPEELLKYGTTIKKQEHSAYGAFFKKVDTNEKATKITFD
ncbi:DEAD-domain-containing protein [Microthyrium microscopicum]|uniref:RNA helicase n=1 Tax=Microthyrium microscopicum TaxID=703497 RepID=A0A6A6TXI4_9PEZI|nr:DEAD-domain-containing protein [Microthyrium microscopicum]